MEKEWKRKACNRDEERAEDEGIQPEKVFRSPSRSISSLLIAFSLEKKKVSWVSQTKGRKGAVKKYERRKEIRKEIKIKAVQTRYLFFIVLIVPD